MRFFPFYPKCPHLDTTKVCLRYQPYRRWSPRLISLIRARVLIARAELLLVVVFFFEEEKEEDDQEEGKRAKAFAQRQHTHRREKKNETSLKRRER